MVATSFVDMRRLERTIDSACQLGFDYVDGDLTCMGYKLIYVERLRDFHVPNHVRDGRSGSEQVEMQDDIRRKSWFAAQSEFYELRLGHVETKTLRNLRNDLVDLIDMDACDYLGKSTAPVERVFLKKEEIEGN
ncbi:hypothetical protein CORC01_02737 [Colletotrichum orchidophilum]|uniref:Uncharacterized protein n=1 Tax=Colletotrichum orchidophilum TaxID=1209926 RepID=A0A1G4BK98_9PEZI|nr:uncharacterized protein CORC01_02737 [Colletotrichum orchidophilum]OHF01859.1 hypothetical protein CORC01_02737 [Colletotrichum orchidophilum]